MTTRVLLTLLLLTAAGCGGGAALDADPARFTDGRALALDPGGRLYVVDAYSATVSVRDTNGVILQTIGGPGQGDHALFEPTDVDPTNGLSLFVADAGNGRIQQFSSRGQLVQTLRIPRRPGRADVETPPSDAGRIVPGTASGESAEGRPVAVAAGPAGILYVAEAETGRVQKWNAGRFDALVGDASGQRAVTRRPVGLAVAGDGSLFVADAERGEVLAFGPLGAFAFSFQAPDVRDVAVYDGRLVVTQAGTVQLRDLSGKLLASHPVRQGGAQSAALARDGSLWILFADRLQRVELGD